MKNKIIALLKEYIDNKKRKKKLKEERIRFWQENKCKNGDCIKGSVGNTVDPVTNERIDNPMKDEKDYCDVCKKRHEFYMALKKIQYRNGTIMRLITHLYKYHNSYKSK